MTMNNDTIVFKSQPLIITDNYRLAGIEPGTPTDFERLSP